MTAQRTDNDILAPFPRWAGLLIVAGMLLLFDFFKLHESMDTGFFTEKFGWLEQLCLYVPIFVTLTAPIVRAVTGRENVSRPFDAAASLLLGMGSFWLWLVFPFDFAHLGDFLPGILHAFTNVINNTIGSILLILQWVTGPITAIATLLKYFSVQQATFSI